MVAAQRICSHNNHHQLVSRQLASADRPTTIITAQPRLLQAASGEDAGTGRGRGAGAHDVARGALDAALEKFFEALDVAVVGGPVGGGVAFLSDVK